MGFRCCEGEQKSSSPNSIWGEWDSGRAKIKACWDGFVLSLWDKDRVTLRLKN